MVSAPFKTQISKADNGDDVASYLQEHERFALVGAWSKGNKLCDIIF
jgi:hypothetical protein